MVWKAFVRARRCVAAPRRLDDGAVVPVAEGAGGASAVPDDPLRPRLEGAGQGGRDPAPVTLDANDNLGGSSGSTRMPRELHADRVRLVAARICHSSVGDPWSMASRVADDPVDGHG